MGQGDKEQGGPGAHVQPVGKAGGDNHQSGHQGGNGVKEGGLLGQGHHVLLGVQVGPVDNHAAARDGQGEEGLTHGPDPHHGVEQIGPPGGEHILIALHGPGQEGHPDGQNQEDDKEQGHHHLVGPLDASGPQEEGEQSAHHHNHMEGDHRVVRQGEGLKPRPRVHAHQRPAHRGGKGLEHIGNNHRVAQGDAHGARQRQPAQQAAGGTQLLLPAGPGHLIGAQGAGVGPAAHGILGGQAHRAEEHDEKQVGQQEGPAAVAAHLGGEAPHVGHAHGRPNRRQNKTPTAGKTMFLVIHKKLLCFVRHFSGRMFSPQNRV